jgi:hypothetical protein
MLSRGLTAGGKQHHSIIRAALFGAMALGTLTGGASIANAQQGRSADQLAADAATKQFFQNPQADPNLPGLESPVDLPLKVSWNYGGGNIAYPQLSVNDPGRPTLRGVQYYGWNEEGSLLRGDDGKVYVWKLKENSLTERYKSLDAVPTSVLASLKNSESKHEYLASRQAEPAPKPAAPVQVAKNDGGVLADAAKRAVDASRAAQPTRRSEVASFYSATGASLKGDMLTLTLADGTSKALKVERPPTPAIAGVPSTASGDIAGTWLSFDANKIVVVKGDGRATVTDMDPRLRASFEQIKKMRDQR